MWSVGVIVYILLTGLSPFLGDSDHETIANVTTGLFQDDLDTFQAMPLALDFIAKVLVKRKENRLTAAASLNHPWLQEVSSNIESVYYMPSCLSLLPEASRKLSVETIDTTKLQRYWARKKWKKACGALKAVQRISLPNKRKMGQNVDLDSILLSSFMKP